MSILTIFFLLAFVAMIAMHLGGHGGHGGHDSRDPEPDIRSDARDAAPVDGSTPVAGEHRHTHA